MARTKITQSSETPDMKNFSKQGHAQQNKDRLNVHWDIVTICQLKCSYCYARNTYGKDWGKIASKDTIDKVIEALSRSTLPFNLGLLGGEPTMAPHYNYIIKKIQKQDKFNKVYVTTNGEKDLRTVETDGVAFLFSFHPADCNDEERFIENVKYIKSKGLQLKVNVLLHPNKKHWERSLKMAKTIQDLGVKIHPHFVYAHWDRKLMKYHKGFFEYFQIFKDLEKDIEFDDELFNDFEVYNYGLTKFKGWSCWNNNYEVDVHGNVVKFCKEENTETSLLLRDLDYFKRIEKTKPMICPHEECNCDGLLKLRKER
jgi:sulfatase maturation enzyme AslB (radical SAM superfamily)